MRSSLTKPKVALAILWAMAWTMLLTPLLPHAQTANEQTLLLEASMECGAGTEYYVPRGRYSEQEQLWLRQLLGYRFSGSQLDFVGTFQEKTEFELTAAEMRKLLENANFSRWIGPDLKRSIHRLMQARARLHSGAIRLSSAEELFRHPHYLTYEAAAENYQRLLIQKFGLQEKDNEVDCD